MKSKGFHPTEIIFSSTTACNLHCEHCFINRTPHKLEIADAVRLIESCVESGSDIDHIGFSGGEPFLYMDFLIEVTKAAISHDLMFDQIMTNGDWWRDESDLTATLQKLYDAGYDGKIGLSWDSYHGQTTERMEAFIRKVREIFGEDSINIQTVEDGEQVVSIRPSDYSTTGGTENTVVECPQSGCIETTIERRHAELVSASTRRPRNKFGVTEFHLPRTYTSDDPRAWQARRWFKEDYCQGPGNILYVHADGNIAPCCGFANENPALFIGTIHDSFETIIQKAAANPMIKICYEEGLSHYRRHGLKNLLRSKKEKLPGKCSDICSFCDYVCKKCN